MSEIQKIRYLPHVDGLRALAIAAVLIFHAFPTALRGGFLGVDVFFVLSGFLISSILLREFADPAMERRQIFAEFYRRRILRIFPALIVVLVVSLAWGFSQFLPSEFAMLGLRTSAGAGFFSNILLARETGYFEQDGANNPLLHLWSLGIEEQFYLLWPVLLWVIPVLRIRLWPALLFVAAGSFFWGLNKSLVAPGLEFFRLETRLWELGIGGLVAVVYPFLARSRAHVTRPNASFRRIRLVAENIAAAGGMGLVIYGFLTVRADPYFPDERALLPTVGTALLLGAGEEAWLNRRVLSWRLFVGLGLISYPLYLWHWPLLCAARLIFDQPDATAWKLIAVGGAILLAWLTYRYVERPFRHGSRTWNKAGILLAGMALVAAAGSFTYFRKGFPSRFPPLIQELADFNYPYRKEWRQGTNFLNRGQSPTDFRTDPAEFSVEKPTLYLWGDSHAAALSPGLRAHYGAAMNIIQRTIAGLPPFVNTDINQSGNGRACNDFILSAIARDRPSYVVLAANWPEYEWGTIANTIQALQRIGIPHIVVVGPVPQWTAGLPQELSRAYLKHPHQPLPLRLSTGLSAAPFEIDPQLGALVTKLGVRYLSPCSVLRNEDGCLVRTGEGAASLVTFDYGHLTAAGSTYVFEHLPPF